MDHNSIQTKKRCRLWTTLGFVVMLGTGHAYGESALVSEYSVSLSLAQQAAAAAVAKCQHDGYRVSAAVVDAGGNIKALLRADGAGPHTQDSSFKKAYTAASLRRSTNELAALIVKIPEIQALRDMNDRILILGGGLPIVIEGKVVGGIGVGGAPGAHLDEACARAGLTRIGAALPQTQHEK
ncbi:MAG: heme-binding protein [Nitrospirae bacterium]|nr:MAG: heme-binding protein [Nitrospirota bacterium]